MPRPSKATVDYFSHDAHHGKTLHLLESKWGNDGYACWFKILELLASSDLHYIDCRDSANWEYLLSKTRLSEETAQEIIEKLAQLSAINRTLWENHRIIYSENFVSRISDAYRKRPAAISTLEKVYSDANIHENSDRVTEQSGKQPLFSGMLPEQDSTVQEIPGNSRKFPDFPAKEKEKEKEKEERKNLMTESGENLPVPVVPKLMKPKPDPRHGWYLRWFVWASEETTGAPYLVAKKDAGIVKTLLALGLDELVARSCHYLALPDEQRYPRGSPTLPGLAFMANQIAGKDTSATIVTARQRGILPPEGTPLNRFTPWKVNHENQQLQAA